MTTSDLPLASHSHQKKIVKSRCREGLCFQARALEHRRKRRRNMGEEKGARNGGRKTHQQEIVKKMIRKNQKKIRWFDSSRCCTDNPNPNRGLCVVWVHEQQVAVKTTSITRWGPIKTSRGGLLFTFYSLANQDRGTPVSHRILPQECMYILLSTEGCMENRRGRKHCHRQPSQRVCIGCPP